MPDHGPEAVYKACDIRGHADDELSPARFRHWGVQLGGRLPVGSCVVGGGDVRLSTPAFLEALIDGLLEAGVTVLDLGVVPTPVVHFARRHLAAAGGAIVTASHSPPQINGLKWMLGDRPPVGDEVRSLRGDEATARPGGRRVATDIDSDYRSWLQARWQDVAAGGTGLVVVDPGNGSWSGRARACLAQAFGSMRFVAIHDRPDGRFPDRDPDCSRPRHLAALSAAVRDQQAVLGVAFDGDGDRVAFVDDEGVALRAEEALQILLRSLGPSLAGQTFVHDLKFSDRVVAAARDLGARPLAQRSGHAFLRRAMLDTGALFGAEISGHYFDAELGGGDDGLFTACRLIAYLAGAGSPLSALRRACTPVFMTADLRLAVDPERQPAILDAIARAFADYPQGTIDGVRVEFPRGWALVRRSVTEAMLTVRFEGDSAAGLEAIVAEFCAAVPELGNQLQTLYHNDRENGR